MKFYPHGTSGRDGSTVTYDTMKDHVIDQIQKSYKYGIDIAKSLRNMKLDDMKATRPTRDIATTGSDEDKKSKQTELDMIFSGELKQWQK